MAEAVFVQEGCAVDYTPAADTPAGTVVVQGDLVGVMTLDTKANQPGALTVEGIFDFAKPAATPITTGTILFWDDTLNVDHGSGRAESVWCAMQFCRAARDLAELAEELGRAAQAERLRGHAGVPGALRVHRWHDRQGDHGPLRSALRRPRGPGHGLVPDRLTTRSGPGPRAGATAVRVGALSLRR